MRPCCQKPDRKLGRGAINETKGNSETASILAHPDRFQLSEITNVVPSPIVSSPATRRQPTQGSTVEDEVDAREVDKVISEVAGMASRWNLFRRFLYDRLRVCALLYELLPGD